MCKVCNQYTAGKIDGKSALKNLDEQISNETDPEKKEKLTRHLFVLSEVILAKEVPPSETDDQADQLWWNSNHED